MSVKHRLPVVLTGEGIGVALAQESNLVGLDKLIDGCGIGAEFLVIELNGTSVLFAAMDGLDFLVALN